MLAASAATVQAKPSSRAPGDEDFRRSQMVGGEAMISRSKLWKRIVFSTALVAATIGPSSAQKLQMPGIGMDCSAYQRRDDGNWTVVYRNKVVLGGNVKKDVLSGDDPQAVELTPGTHLHGVLNATCGRFKK